MPLPLLLLCQLALPASPPDPQRPTARDSAAHALDRLAFGPTPGLVDSVARTGVARWIASQLDHRSAGDDGLRMEERRFALLSTSPDELARRYAEMTRLRQLARRDATAMAPSDSLSAAAARPEPLPEARAFRELTGQLDEVAVLRAVRSRAQLGEVMTDFWTNHFNVFLNKGADRFLLPSFIEGTIRPRVLGRFEDLLLATARSPAMLFYLDNVESVMPGSSPPPPRRPDGRMAMRGPPGPRGTIDVMAPLSARRPDPRRARPSGINENYARELLELHTLGVDGGYTQQDVQEVARIFTGWGMHPARDGGGFEFHAWAHDDGEKMVLGQRFPAGRGEDEGVRLLRLLANHPATMHHLAAKLCQRFVADVAPDGCVDDAVHAWRRTHGDLREVVRAIVTGPDFWVPASMRGKVKSPFEFAVSAVRAVGGVPDSTGALAQLVRRLGQPLYLQPSPAGYPERSDEWTNSGALLARMNAAVALANGSLKGLHVALDSLLPVDADLATLVEHVNDLVLAGHMSPQTRAAITAELRDARNADEARALAVGLALGGPDFQRQ